MSASERSPESSQNFSRETFASISTRVNGFVLILIGEFSKAIKLIKLIVHVLQLSGSLLRHNEALATVFDRALKEQLRATNRRMKHGFCIASRPFG